MEFASEAECGEDEVTYIGLLVGSRDGHCLCKNCFSFSGLSAKYCVLGPGEEAVIDGGGVDGGISTRTTDRVAFSPAYAH